MPHIEPADHSDLLHRLDLMLVSPPHQLSAPHFRTVKQAYACIEKLTKANTILTKELLEQARVNGMGASRELRLITERDQLRAFAKALFADNEWPSGGDIDGFTFQDLAVKHGLLIPEQRTEFCSPECNCAEYHGDPEGGFTCYRKAEFLIDTP